VTGLSILPELFADQPAPRTNEPQRIADAPLDSADIIVLGAGSVPQIGNAEPAPEAVAEAEAEPEPADQAGAELDAEPAPEAVAEAEAEPEPADQAGAELDAEPAPEAAPEAEAAQLTSAAHDDSEADWADLFRRLPDAIADEPVADDWSALAPWLGPDVAPVDPAPAIAHEPMTVASTPPAPVVPPQPAVAWQITAPAPETETKPAQWPPLGPVFRPQPAAPQPAPHPSVLARRPASNGLLTRGQAPQAGPQSMPNGVRPCVNCELPLSATARFCRRCGRPQA
jgi:hypothetical protein